MKLSVETLRDGTLLGQVLARLEGNKEWEKIADWYEIGYNGGRPHIPPPKEPVPLSFLRGLVHREFWVPDWEVEDSAMETACRAVGIPIVVRFDTHVNAHEEPDSAVDNRRITKKVWDDIPGKTGDRINFEGKGCLIVRKCKNRGRPFEIILVETRYIDPDN